MNAAKLLREVRASGIELEIVGARARIIGTPDPDLRERIRANRAELMEVLFGNRCRCCGERLAWPDPVGIIYADQSAECHSCSETEVWRIQIAADRAVSSPEALADPAEVMLRGEIE